MRCLLVYTELPGFWCLLSLATQHPKSYSAVRLKRNRERTVLVLHVLVCLLKSHRAPPRDSGSSGKRYHCDVENAERKLSQRHRRCSGDLPHMTR